MSTRFILRGLLRAHLMKVHDIMPRPTILVAEPEPLQALSVRKLVLETAKFNVLTAHSSREALDIFHLFPNVSCAVLVPGKNIDCEMVAREVKKITKKVPVVFLHSAIGAVCKHADQALLSGEPEELLSLIRSLFGDPRTQEPGEELRTT